MQDVFPLVVPIPLHSRGVSKWACVFVAYRDGVDADAWLDDAVEETWPSDW